MHKQRPLIANSTWSLAQAVCSALLLVYFYKLGISYIGLKSFGLWSVVVSASSLTRLLDVGMGSGVTKLVAEAHAQKRFRDVRRLIDTSFLSLALLLVCASPLLFFILQTILYANIQNNIDISVVSPLLVLTLFTASLNITSSSTFGTLSALKRNDFLFITIILPQVAAVSILNSLCQNLGIYGLSAAQAIQSVATLLLGRIIMAVHFRYLGLSLLPNSFSRDSLSAIFRYGAKFQLGVIFMIAFDMSTKLFFAHFNELKLAAIFELANTTCQRLRGLVTTANSVVTAYLASELSSTRQTVRKYWIPNFKIVLISATLLISVISLSSEPISFFLLDEKNILLMTLLSILSLSWSINILCAPSYFCNLGIGSQRLNIMAHAIIAASNLLLVIPLSSIFGGYGIALAYSLALIIGSLCLIHQFMNKYLIIISDACTFQSASLFLVAVLSSFLVAIGSAVGLHHLSIIGFSSGAAVVLLTVIYNRATITQIYTKIS